jgi:hypothetical protein
LSYSSRLLRGRKRRCPESARISRRVSRGRRNASRKDSFFRHAQSAHGTRDRTHAGPGTSTFLERLSQGLIKRTRPRTGVYTRRNARAHRSAGTDKDRLVASFRCTKFSETHRSHAMALLCISSLQIHPRNGAQCRAVHRRGGSSTVRLLSSPNAHPARRWIFLIYPRSRS